MKKTARRKPTISELAAIAAQLLGRHCGDAKTAAAEAVRISESCATEIEASSEVARAEAREKVEFETLRKEAAAQPLESKSHFENFVGLLNFYDPAGALRSEPVSFEKALI